MRSLIAALSLAMLTGCVGAIVSDESGTRLITPLGSSAAE